eukprot:354325-Chlamydomonas_euryale.AAC.2
MSSERSWGQLTCTPWAAMVELAGKRFHAHGRRRNGSSSLLAPLPSAHASASVASPSTAPSCRLTLPPLLTGSPRLRKGYTGGIPTPGNNPVLVRSAKVDDISDGCTTGAYCLRPICMNSLPTSKEAATPRARRARGPLARPWPRAGLAFFPQGRTNGRARRQVVAEGSISFFACGVETGAIDINAAECAYPCTEGRAEDGMDYTELRRIRPSAFLCNYIITWSKCRPDPL